MLLMFFTSVLDDILATRADITAVPFSGNRQSDQQKRTTALGKVGNLWGSLMHRIRDILELWTGPKDDKTVAWTLGIGWACCGGGLAGGTLVFAKATVKLLSGSLSHENPGNQFGHAAPIFTIILLVITAVLQIVCLNRGLKVYDSTLVVPVFYGVYTAAGYVSPEVSTWDTCSYCP